MPVGHKRHGGVPEAGVSAYGVRVIDYGIRSSTDLVPPTVMIDHGIGVIAHGTGLIDNALSHQ
jgi:hypothetical protein